MQYCFYESPIGRLLIAGTATELWMLGFAGSQPEPTWTLTNTPFELVLQQLQQYFAGQRHHFTIPLHYSGTKFQQQVLRQVAKVPYGNTASYSEIASKIKNPRAVRAVGTANATNQLPIVIPCHRIIGKNGTLTGFGGGLTAKKFLLDLERNGNTSRRIP